ncbi:hypothetical protein [Actinomadura verrucosospora]|uniref:Serine/threonine protein kinase n=1 Tax=Actinomadura verrucosospora TaxID=46165 RepID=A0A7D3VUZ2_ACTVE|nr:hypothetical protein [Actinomadura verrucosospora]QKG21694.1 serine/threonine protein kinase [Actinomadura verrucosospora]
MRNWSDSPFPRRVALSAVGAYADDAVVARDNGESSVIYEAPGHPGWLVKRYKPQARVEQARLGALIELPASMPPDDLRLVDRSVAWPVAQVVDGYRTVGAIMARAPEEFSWDIALLEGRTKRTTVEVDLLANPAERIRRFGLPEPDDALRLGAMRQLVAVAALFERHDLVYGDWSFANAFWAPGTERILVIDMDASGIGERDWVETTNWEDPLQRAHHPLTTHTDRYKVALLVARAVTGLRGERQRAVEEMRRQYPAYGRLVELLLQSLDAAAPDQRPRLADVLAAMDQKDPANGPDGANVTGMIAWNPGSRRGSGRSGPPRSPDRAASRPRPGGTRKPGTRTPSAGRTAPQTGLRFASQPAPRPSVQAPSAFTGSPRRDVTSDFSPSRTRPPARGTPARPPSAGPAPAVLAVFFVIIVAAVVALGIAALS